MKKIFRTVFLASFLLVVASCGSDNKAGKDVTEADVKAKVEEFRKKAEKCENEEEAAEVLKEMEEYCKSLPEDLQKKFEELCEQE